MPPLSSILTDHDPQGVLEIGRDRHGGAWAATPDLIEAQVIDLPDRERWVPQPEALIGEFARLDAPLQLVVDHADREPSTAVNFIEAIFGWLTPGGLYVLDCPLPAEPLLQLMLTTVRSSDVVQRVDLTPRTTVLTRGSSIECPNPLRLVELVSDPFGVVA